MPHRHGERTKGAGMGWFRNEMKHWWRTYTEGLPFFPVFALVLVTCLVILDETYGKTGYFRHHLGWMKDDPRACCKLLPHLYWFGMSFLFYAAIPIASLWIFRKRLKDFGLRLGDWRLGLKVMVVFAVGMALVVAVAVQTDSFSSHYPFNKAALAGVGPFLLYESFYWLYFFAWEFVWRGYLLFGLYPHIKNWAIVVQMVPFAILHVGKPVPEVFASVFAGLLLGAFALRSRSMLYCWLLHAIAASCMDFSVFTLKGTWAW